MICHHTSSVGPQVADIFRAGPVRSVQIGQVVLKELDVMGFPGMSCIPSIICTLLPCSKFA